MARCMNCQQHVNVGKVICGDCAPQLVAVVRCGECKHKLKCLHHKEKEGGIFGDNDFCSYGERGVTKNG